MMVTVLSPENMGVDMSMLDIRVGVFVRMGFTLEKITQGPETQYDK